MRKTNKITTISRISKNVKIGINQQEMLNDFNIRINKKLKEFNSSSETTRAISFNEWLGGMMDSDGCFYLSKKNYLRCDITVSTHEIDSLYKIKAKFGGSIYLREGVNAYRWELYKKNLVKQFLISLNGHIYQKIDKYDQVMKIYAPEVQVIRKDFKLSGAWFSGFFEGDGCVFLSKRDRDITFTITQKKSQILEHIKNVYGGNISYNKTRNLYVWRASNKEDLLNLFDYFTLNPLKSTKNADIVSAKRFFRYRLLGYHLDKSKHKQLDHFIKLFRDRRKI